MNKLLVQIKLEGRDIEAEVDTGCPIFLINSDLYSNKFKSIKKLTPFPKRLFTATQQRVQVIGSFHGKISHATKEGHVEVVVCQLLYLVCQPLTSYSRNGGNHSV